jgi:hypothetical protein
VVITGRVRHSRAVFTWARVPRNLGMLIQAWNDGNPNYVIANEPSWQKCSE